MFKNLVVTKTITDIFNFDFSRIIKTYQVIQKMSMHKTPTYSRGSIQSKRSIISSIGSHETVITATTGVTYTRRKSKHRTADELQRFRSEYETADHILPIDELEQKYTTSVVDGLTQEKADELLQKYGANCLAGEPKTSKWLLLFRHLFLGFAILMWMGVILSCFGAVFSYLKDIHGYIEHIYLAVILFLVIVITGVFGYYQEATNVAIMESFQKLVPKHATVIRDGSPFVIPSEELVIGDLVVLRPGDWIPADLRLTEVNRLKVDHSSITGESQPQSRSADLYDNDPLETPNLAFYMTSVVEGSGKGIVINTGEYTLIGHIAGLASSLKKGSTPLRQEINRFIKYISIIALTIGFAFLIALLALGNNFFECFASFIAMTIANVPESLPVTLTACMTLTARAMAAKNCLVKKHEAIETLGCCNVICSDKTGTLTQNKMKVVHMYFDNYSHWILDNESFVDKENVTFQALCLVGTLNSNAVFEMDDGNIPIKQRRVLGDASEGAILKCLTTFHLKVLEVRAQYPKVCEIPFNSTTKYQISIHLSPQKTYLLTVKGAPERVLPRCTSIFRLGEAALLDLEGRGTIMKQVNNLGNRGERVLAFADLDLSTYEKYQYPYFFDPDQKNFPTTGFRFVGLMSLMDPPRPSVPHAVEVCKTAGIRIIMITGDHPVTAAAIARQVGIFSATSVTAYDVALEKDVPISNLTQSDLETCTAAIITGSNLRQMSDLELEHTLKNFYEIVFARTSPQQKLKIVEALQHMKQIVAVTGDGVNDSPALKAANIGVAMGITGSDVSKEAADIIILDDNFSSIVTGVEEGRLIFDNLKKSIAYLLTSNVPEILPFLAMMVLNIPPPLSVISVIIIDVGADLWPAISLAYEKAEADIMTRAPRNPKTDTLINERLIFFTYAEIGVIQFVASFLVYNLVMAYNGFFMEDLIGINNDWMDKKKNITNHFNKQHDFDQRMYIQRQSCAGYFLTISLTQVTDLWICKTRRLSIFQQGMDNWVLNFAMFFELGLSLFLVYTPYLNEAITFAPVPGLLLLPAVPYAFFLFIIDEIRKYIIRKNPKGLVAQYTYY